MEAEANRATCGAYTVRNDTRILLPPANMSKEAVKQTATNVTTKERKSKAATAIALR